MPGAVAESVVVQVEEQDRVTQWEWWPEFPIEPQSDIATEKQKLLESAKTTWLQNLWGLK